MRRYELMLLLRPDLEDDKLQASVEKVTRAIVNGGGSLSKVSPWGKRRLAYDIGHHREASYFLIQFDIEPAQVREIERGMLISEEIMRHLVTVLEDRGTPDELAPAAAARADGDENGNGADDADRAPVSGAVADDADRPLPRDTDADDALEADDVSDDDDTSDDTSNDEVAEVDAGTDEPAAEGDGVTERSLT